MTENPAALVPMMEDALACDSRVPALEHRQTTTTVCESLNRRAGD
jgi:hypothetical protein